MAGISLVLPPGWTLHPGGPHIAMPLLKGYLQSHGIETRTYDLNIGSTQYHGVYIEEREVSTACKTLTASAMNEVYFKAEDKLQRIAQCYDGTWFAHEGYRRNNCNIASSEDIRRYSQSSSPFTNYFQDDVVPKILKEDPRIIGITLIVPTQILQAFELIRCLRKESYKGLIVLGGNIITRIYDDMAVDWVFDLVDGIIKLQGERSLLQLYRAIERGKGFSEVPNMMWRNEGVIKRNPPELLKKAEFAAPDFSEISPSDYWGTNYLTMVASRGCYYGKCTFCAIPFGYGEKGYIGSSPTQDVLNSMKNATKRTGINRFKFIDEALHPKMMRNLAALLERESQDFQFEAYVRLESSWLEPDLIPMSAKAGLKKVYLGLELVPSDERDLLAKSDGADPVRLLKELRDAGIKAHVFCMFGFPGTGVKEAFNTIDFAIKHAELIDTLDVFPFYYARHTRVEGVKILEDLNSRWNVEHRYEPAAPEVMAPSQVHILAEKLGNLIWNEQPQWLHPIYRMFSPWNIP